MEALVGGGVGSNIVRVCITKERTEPEARFQRHYRREEERSNRIAESV